MIHNIYINYITFINNKVINNNKIYSSITIVSKFARRCFAFSASNGEMHYRCCMQVTSVMTCKLPRDVTKINALKRETCYDWTGRSVNR